MQLACPSVRLSPRGRRTLGEGALVWTEADHGVDVGQASLLLEGVKNGFNLRLNLILRTLVTDEATLGVVERRLAQERHHG